MGLSNVRTPVASSDGDDRELGDNDGTSDGGSDLLGALDTETDVAERSATVPLIAIAPVSLQSPTNAAAFHRQ